MDHPDGGIPVKPDFPARIGQALWGLCSSSPTWDAQLCPSHGVLSSFPTPGRLSSCSHLERLQTPQAAGP